MINTSQFPSYIMRFWPCSVAYIIKYLALGNLFPRTKRFR